MQQPQIKELNTQGNGPCLVVQNVQERSFETYEEGLAVVRQALSRRQVHETTKNIESSRSHAIFVIKLYSRESEGGNELEQTMLAYLGGSKYSQQNIQLRQQLDKQSNLVSQFTFVDLAGSEKLDGEVDQARLAEAKHINKSLSALGTVIQALKSKHQAGSPVKFKKGYSGNS